MQPWKQLVGATVLLTLAGGCSFKNRPLSDVALPLEQRAQNHTRATVGVAMHRTDHGAVRPADSLFDPHRAAEAPAPGARPADHDGIFVGIAISGGGSRSANFSAACFFQLQKIGLLEHVDYISSVSGGSITAAYYCLHEDAWNPAEVQKRFTHSFASDMIWTILMPWNFPVLLMTDWDRSDILADSFRKVLFSRKGRELTFADLRDDRPRLLINATDLQSGRRFVFSDESFDEINSDLSKYPIAHAVAASAAVPVLLHQVTLRDYSTSFKQYRHLVDGGVVDNLGVHTLLETYDAHQRGALERGEEPPYPRGAVIIVLDAQTSHGNALSEQADFSFLRGIAAGASVASNILVQRAGTATLAEMIVRYAPNDMGAEDIRDHMRELIREGFIELTDRSNRPVHVIHLALNRLNSVSDTPFVGFSSSVNNIQTYFNISQTEAYHLYTAADLLINRKFRDRLGVLKDVVENGPHPEPAE